MTSPSRRHSHGEGCKFTWCHKTWHTRTLIAVHTWPHVNPTDYVKRVFLQINSAPDGAGGAHKGAGEPRIRRAAAWDYPLELIVGSGYWWWKLVGLEFVNSCVINTPEAGGWAGFKRHLGFQCFCTPRQISLHGGFILHSYVLTTWPHAENASPSHPVRRGIGADLRLSRHTCASLQTGCRIRCRLVTKGLLLMQFKSQEDPRNIRVGWHLPNFVKVKPPTAMMGAFSGQMKYFTR